MPESPQHDQWISRFIGCLIGLLGSEQRESDRAALARLRRGLGKSLGESAERDLWVFNALGSDVLRSFEEDAATLVASLFALWHQGDRPLPDQLPKNLGASFAHLHDLTHSESGLAPSERVESVERRFTILLNSDPQDLPDRLRHAVSLLRAQDVPVDWGQLLRDILNWKRLDRRVQRDWARAYWATRNHEHGPETVPNDAGQGD